MRSEFGLTHKSGCDSC